MCLNLSATQTLRAMVMTSLAEVQGQRSVGTEDRVETNGRMDRQMAVLTRSVIKAAVEICYSV